MLRMFTGWPADAMSRLAAACGVIAAPLASMVAFVEMDLVRMFDIIFQ
jgi:hypothetical protein